MKSFSFRLERLLRLRADQERQQARLLGEATREEARLDDELREQASHLERIEEKLTARPGERASAGWLRTLALTAEAAADQLAGTEASRDEARRRVGEERQKLAERATERKAIERLRELKAGEWHEAARRNEQKTTDEVAGRRHREGGDG